MAMKSPMHPGRVLKGEIEELGYSVAQVAEFLGVTRQQLYRVVNAESSVTTEMALRIEKTIGGTADLWLRMQVAYDLAQARPRKLRPDARKLEPLVA
jgi:antitoxin HigA-1